jgi:early endosome antigen 1
MEALLSSEAEEKRALLDRFTSMENEVVSLRSANAELHRKVNDVEGGLHELGRENQSLQVTSFSFQVKTRIVQPCLCLIIHVNVFQMELAKTQNRKWVDDTHVENCQACDKGFTLTNRKHHCRQCGRIYCKDCSSKTATLPSSKKAVRVCDKCYTELHP